MIQFIDLGPFAGGILLGHAIGGDVGAWVAAPITFAFLVWHRRRKK